VRLSDNPVAQVWLPIAVLSSVQGYNELVSATVFSDHDLVSSSSETFEQAVLAAAQDLSAKFVCPPYTMNLAVLFVPTDDLFAEIARRDSLVETMRRDFHVMVASPATLPTLLMGLRVVSKTPPSGTKAGTQARGVVPSDGCKTLGQLRARVVGRPTGSANPHSVVHAGCGHSSRHVHCVPRLLRGASSSDAQAHQKGGERRGARDHDMKVASHGFDKGNRAGQFQQTRSSVGTNNTARFMV